MEKKLGVYIHIPFCASKCGYCDFYSLDGNDGLMGDYQNALLEHILESSVSMEPYYIDSVYFGGGTPSYYGAKRICELFNALKYNAKVLKNAEVTVEVNPDSVNYHDLKMMRKEGINRISIGVQSADDALLKCIGRRHDFSQVKQAVRDARRAGFKNISLDLIYGLPGQSVDAWADTLAKALGLKPQHLSCYGLKLEKGTPMYDACRNSRELPDDDTQADMYLYTVETLQKYGYKQYEISNFAKPGMESRHNIKYWNLDDYIGLGASAHSCMGNQRYSFISNLDGYIEGINGGTPVLDEFETIAPFEKAAEYIMLGMRRTHGINEEEYTIKYRSRFEPIERLLEEYKRRGWAVCEEDGRWHFTTTGFLLSNTLIGAMLDAQAQARSVTPHRKKLYASSAIHRALPEEEPEDGPAFKKRI